ncbi:glycosyltransferase family 2 protein [Flavobacterium sp. 2]|uniref:glycosyltransferase family 2 protein n=1 Tax=Flavobacterium sp. 2 TaxID=308053 RepID=UPI003CEE7450
MTGLSIIITYYKGEKHIFKCLNSIIDSAENAKKKLPFEIILVIDSIEDSLEISSKIKKEYANSKVDLNIHINEKNIGVSESRNIGLQKSKFNYFTIIDQDDYVLQNYFTEIEANLDGLYSAYVINGYIKYESENREIPIYFFKPKFTFKSILNKNTLIYTPGLIIFDSKFVSKSNFFIETSKQYKGCDDWAAYLNLLYKGNCNYKYIKSKIFIYLMHSDNYSNKIDEMINSSISVLDYLSKLEALNFKSKRKINYSYLMQQFYLAKDFKKEKKVSLLKKFPKQFMDHYFFSFFSIDRQNRLIFNMRKILKKKEYN